MSSLIYPGTSSLRTTTILRSPLALTTLKLKLQGVDVKQFDWMDRPTDENLASAARELRLVGAIDENDEVTKIGELAVKLDIQPNVARLIRKGIEDGLSVATGLISRHSEMRLPGIY